MAKVTGNPELTWYKDGVHITQDTRLKANKASLPLKSEGTLLKNQTRTALLVLILGQRGHVRAELCPRAGRRQRQLGGDREERARRDVAVLHLLGADAAPLQDEDQRHGGQREQAGRFTE